MRLTNRYSYVTQLEHRISNLEGKVQLLEREATTVRPAIWQPNQNDQNENVAGETTESFIRLDKDNVQDLSLEECGDGETAVSHTPNTSNFFGMIYPFSAWQFSHRRKVPHPISIC